LSADGGVGGLEGFGVPDDFVGFVGEFGEKILMERWEPVRVEVASVVGFVVELDYDPVGAW
jgi:hypothetical protein